MFPDDEGNVRQFLEILTVRLDPDELQELLNLVMRACHERGSCVEDQSALVFLGADFGVGGAS